MKENKMKKIKIRVTEAQLKTLNHILEHTDTTGFPKKAVNDYEALCDKVEDRHTQATIYADEAQMPKMTIEHFIDGLSESRVKKMKTQANKVLKGLFTPMGLKDIPEMDSFVNNILARTYSTYANIVKLTEETLQRRKEGTHSPLFVWSHGDTWAYLGGETLRNDEEVNGEDS